MRMKTPWKITMQSQINTDKDETNDEFEEIQAEAGYNVRSGCEAEEEEAQRFNFLIINALNIKLLSSF